MDNTLLNINKEELVPSNSTQCEEKIQTFVQARVEQQEDDMYEDARW